jgi:hypothetical protein
MVDDFLEIQAAFPGRLLKFFVKSQIDQVVVQMRAHEKLGRQVADHLGFFFQKCLHRVDKQVLHPVAYGVGDSQENVV